MVEHGHDIKQITMPMYFESSAHKPKAALLQHDVLVWGINEQVFCADHWLKPYWASGLWR